MLLALALLAPVSLRASGAVTLDYVDEEVTIERDGWGVPHIHADTTEAAFFGVGYAAAEDRLWQMHLSRLLFSGHGADIFGSGQIDFLDYPIRLQTRTPAERAVAYERLPEHIQLEVEAYVAGINAYLDEVRADPSRLPLEFVAWRQVVDPAGPTIIAPWTVEDVLSFTDFIAMAVEAGAYELDVLDLRHRLEASAPPAVAAAQFDDLVRTLDPDSPTTVPPDHPWRQTPSRADAPPVDRTLRTDARLGLPPEARLRAEPTAAAAATTSLSPAALSQAADAVGTIGLDAARTLGPPVGSNAQVVDGALVADGVAALTGSPQIEYTVPARYWEFGVHVPGVVEATGMTWAGWPYQIIGRSSRHAWTITNAYADGADLYIETLDPDDPERYLFDGAYEPMDCRDEDFHVGGNPTPNRTERICRTRHGPVLWSDPDNGVAYALRTTRWDRELHQLVSFAGLARADDIGEFATAAAANPANFNLYYADDRGDVGYWHAGYHPDRPAHLDIRLPRDGSGAEEWVGLVPFDEQPHAINPARGWFVNWNNGPAVNYPTIRSWPAIDRASLLEEAFRGVDVPDPLGGPVNDDTAWTAAELDANIRYGAHAWSVPARPFQALLPLGEPYDPAAQAAVDALAGWDGLTIDHDDDGRQDHPGYAILSRFLTELRSDIFGDELGGYQGWARTRGEVWQVLSPDSHAQFGYDWLNGRAPGEVIREAMNATVAELTQEYDSADPTDWRAPAWQQSYQTWNSLTWWGDYAAAVGAATHDNLGVPCPVELVGDTRCLEHYRDHVPDAARPGYIPTHPFQNRGVYFQVVRFPDPGGDVVACNVLTPGNHGTITATGEGPHYRDQVPLYVGWRTKPFAVAGTERPGTASECVAGPAASARSTAR